MGAIFLVHMVSLSVYEFYSLMDSFPITRFASFFGQIPPEVHVDKVAQKEQNKNSLSLIEVGRNTDRIPPDMFSLFYFLFWSCLNCGGEYVRKHNMNYFNQFVSISFKKKKKKKGTCNHKSSQDFNISRPKSFLASKKFQSIS